MATQGVEQSGSYNEQHVNFVSGHTGGAASEIAIISLVTPLAVLFRDLCVAWTFQRTVISWWKKLIIDCLLLVLPVIWSCTLMANHIDGLLSALLFASVAVILFSEKARSVFRPANKIPCTWSSIMKIKVPSKWPAITNFRAFTNICVACGILAVDFSIFPRRFCKTETYGTGMMDAGVGAYIIANALVAPEARGKFNVGSSFHDKCRVIYKVVLSCVPLLVLGMGRVLAVKSTDYHEHISEYGVHWNFFFTLAAVKLLSAILYTLVGPQFTCLLGLATICAYEYLLLGRGLREYVLTGSDGRGSRVGLLDANREGVYSALGYLALYLLAVQVGAYMVKPRNHLRDWFKVLVVLTFADVLLWILMWLSELHVDEVSRRMANLSYCIWILAHNLLLLCVYVMVDIVELTVHHLQLLPKSGSKFCLVEAVNRNGLAYFLLANVLTGAVNKSIATIHTPAILAHLVVTGYMLVLSSVTALLHVRGVVLKFW